MKSTVSDTWSTDVLASDSEPPEMNQQVRLDEIAEEMVRQHLLATQEVISCFHIVTGKGGDIISIFQCHKLCSNLYDSTPYWTLSEFGSEIVKTFTSLLQKYWRGSLGGEENTALIVYR